MIDMHFLIRPKFIAQLRVLLGMVFANRPWKIMPSFKPVIAVSFATGAYGLIFPTLWTVSGFLEISRFIGLMVTAIISIIVWIIVSHDLWEKSTKKNKYFIRRLYNEATILTLVVAVLFYYVILFALFLIGVSLFISPDAFAALTDLKGDIGFGNYVKLAWLATSVATLAGAIGAGLENEEKVQNITYGYRQRIRLQRMQEQSAKEEEPGQ